MSKNILKFCFILMLLSNSFIASAQYYDLPSEVEVLDYWREAIRESKQISYGDYHVPDNEADIRSMYDNAANGNPDALASLGYFLVSAGNGYKGLYFLIQAKKQGSKEAVDYISNMDIFAVINYNDKLEDWFQLTLQDDQDIIDMLDGQLSSLSVAVACQYFDPDPEGYLGPFYYSANKRELSKLNTGRHGCEPYDKNIRDYAKARRYFLRAVDFSLPRNDATEMDIYRATQALGVIYRDGLGVPVDKRTAAFYFMATEEAE